MALVPPYRFLAPKPSLPVGAPHQANIFAGIYSTSWRADIRLSNSCCVRFSVASTVISGKISGIVASL